MESACENTDHFAHFSLIILDVLWGREKVDEGGDRVLQLGMKIEVGRSCPLEGEVEDEWSAYWKTGSQSWQDAHSCCTVARTHEYLVTNK